MQGHCLQYQGHGHFNLPSEWACHKEDNVSNVKHLCQKVSSERHLFFQKSGCGLKGQGHSHLNLALTARACVILWQERNHYVLE